MAGFLTCQSATRLSTTSTNWPSGIEAATSAFVVQSTIPILTARMSMGRQPGFGSWSVRRRAGIGPAPFRAVTGSFFLDIPVAVRVEYPALFKIPAMHGETQID